MSGEATPTLTTYDRGYRDGWADIHISQRQRRKRQRLRSTEYALGYGHGREDGAEHPDWPRWWPDYATAPSVSEPRSLNGLRATERAGEPGSREIPPLVGFDPVEAAK